MLCIISSGQPLVADEVERRRRRSIFSVSCENTELNFRANPTLIVLVSFPSPQSSLLALACHLSTVNDDDDASGGLPRSIDRSGRPRVSRLICDARAHYMNTVFFFFLRLRAYAFTLLLIGFALRSVQTHISKQFHIEMCVCTLLKANPMNERVRAYDLRGKINFTRTIYTHANALVGKSKSK